MKTFLYLLVFVLINTHWHAQLVFFGNLHSHTSYSDGSGTPLDAYNHARYTAGLHFLAVTEHNHKQARSKIVDSPQLYNGNIGTSLISSARTFTQEGQFIALYGQEFSTIADGNHVNVLEVGKVILPSEVPNGRFDLLFDNWLNVNLDSENKPAIVLLNHPATAKSPDHLEYGIDDYPTVEAWRAALSKHVSLINIINGPSHKTNTKPAKPSENEFRRYLGLGLHVAPTADQDNHEKNWGSAADTRTAVIAPSLTKANILQALRNRHVYASEDKNLEIIARANGELMGKIFDRASCPPLNSPVQFEISIADPDEPDAMYKIEIVSGVIGSTAKADVVKRVHHAGNGTVNVSGISYTTPNQYFYLRISQSYDDEEDPDRVYTAPVWFEPNSNRVNTTFVSLEVDVFKEEAVITNRGTQEVDLKNWVLVSVVGNQRYTFRSSTKLAPGQSFSVLSGPNARARAGAVVWSTTNIWSNAGDPGQLLDSTGNLQAEWLDEDEQ